MRRWRLQGGRAATTLVVALYIPLLGTGCISEGGDMPEALASPEAVAPSATADLEAPQVTDDAPDPSDGAAVDPTAPDAVAGEPLPGDVTAGGPLGFNAFNALKKVGPCKVKTFKYYPGSPDGKWRYGRFDVHFEICKGVTPNSWHRSVPYANENATGNNMGVIISGGSVRATTLGSYYGFFEAVVPWKECIPKTNWCVRTGAFRVQYYAFVVEGKPSVSEMSIAGQPEDIKIYRTP